MADGADGPGDVLHRLVEGTARATGAAFFEALVANLSLGTGAAYAFIAELAGSPKRVRTLAFFGAGRPLANVEYDLAGTPCEAVARGKTAHHPRDLQRAFPADSMLRELGLESYLGVPLRDATGDVLGHLAVLDTGPLPEDRDRFAILEIFAARATAELERARLQQQNRYLQEEIRSAYDFAEIVGSATSLREALGKLEQVAPTDATILILGETGTGKELVARAAHRASRRAEKPLIKVNCAALSPELIESELFGHEKGAVTGALERRIGRFALADGGTIFLDEIGDITPELQLRLLRVLQEREFEPVGSSETVRVDVRVIAATHRDLAKAVARGRFRADLYHRLNVFPIQIPPLRERREDVVLLAHHFIDKYAARIGRRIDTIGPDTLRRLAEYSWPGNVRELANVIERAVILATGTTLELEPDVLRATGDGHAAGAPARRRTDAAPPPAGATLAESERRAIVRALERCGWVVEGERGAARALDLSPSTLRSRMKKLGIHREGPLAE
jgi:formate hydrogenlyase transcriptional activator